MGFIGNGQGKGFLERTWIYRNGFWAKIVLERYVMRGFMGQVILTILSLFFLFL